MFGSVVMMSAVLTGAGAATAVEQGPTSVALACELTTDSGVAIALQPVSPATDLVTAVTVDIREGFLGPTDDVALGPTVRADTDLLPAIQVAVASQYPGFTASVPSEDNDQSRLVVEHRTSAGASSVLSFQSDGPSVHVIDGSIATSGVIDYFSLDRSSFQPGSTGHEFLLSDLGFAVEGTDADGSTIDAGTVTCTPASGQPALIATYAVPDGTVALSGTVSLGAASTPAVGAKVELQRTDGAVVSVGSTTVTGAYTVTAPKPGQYRILFTPFSETASYKTLYLGGTPDPEAATIVNAVSLPQMGLDIALPLGDGEPAVAYRIGGADRYEAALSVSKNHWGPGSADTVWVATGQNYPDALSAGPAAIVGHDPILLTPTASLPSSVKDEILRLGASKIVVVGGPSSVSDEVLGQLKSVVPNTTRISGADRYEVSRNVAEYAFSDRPDLEVYVATGTKFPDALSAGAVAGARNAPVLLVRGDAGSLDSATLATVAALGVDGFTVAGGPASVSQQIEAQLAGIAPTDRASGADRFEVAANLNLRAIGNSEYAYLASGEKFADALSGGASAGGFAAPLYLSQADCVPAGTLAAIKAEGIEHVVLIGGVDSLRTPIEALKTC
ncbi:cell wall-binding repeat-containing protein [Herbiconiux sp. P15]|uniref:cell wall-binding repeat-containing protein n=1 Tax=Herbiconiux liukaitaii TaxID=3342799 RepID=UPI0035B74DCC